MNRKVSIIILAIFLAIIVFSVSTYLQKQLVAYVPTVECLIATDNFLECESLNEPDVKKVNMPIEIVSNTKVVKNYDEIKDLYLKSDLLKGQILVLDQFDTQENLAIFNGEEGKEKISIKVKSPENGTSFILKKGSKVNVYATINNEYANSEIFADNEKVSAGTKDYGYSTIKLLSDIKVLGTFDDNGEEVENTSEKNIDTILVAVLPEEAQIINLIRDLAVFNITEL